jgi:hypothetical protein
MPRICCAPSPPKSFRPSPVHKQSDPRADKLLALADEWGLAGAHVAALRALASQVLPFYGKPFPMNVSAAIPAVLLDAGYPIGALKGIPLLARTASLVAHLLEEQARPIGFKLAAAAAADRAMRPAPLHFRIVAPGQRPLVTHIFDRQSAVLGDDAVFGVRPSLVADFARHGPGTPRRPGDAGGLLHARLRFVLSPTRASD